MMTSCPFCAIIAGDEDAIFVGKWPSAIAFFPKDPATIGHTLVVPRVHIANIWHMNSLLARDLGEIVLDMAHRLRVALSLEGMNIINSAGEVASQTIEHLHVHLVPRYRGDAIGDIWPDFSNVSTEEIQVAASALRSEGCQNKE
ncbi:MAG: HIT family protein [Pseudonocardiaceae bacterium]